MKTRVNPPFSKISFLLFHEGETDANIDAGTLPVSADELARAAEQLGKWTDLPGESEQSKQVFYEYATSLRTDAVGHTSTARHAASCSSGVAGCRAKMLFSLRSTMSPGATCREHRPRPGAARGITARGPQQASVLVRFGTDECRCHVRRLEGAEVIVIR